MQQTPVEGVGRYSQITIVRCESWGNPAEGSNGRFYILVDKNNRKIGQSWAYLVNARRQARKLVTTYIDYR